MSPDFIEDGGEAGHGDDCYVDVVKDDDQRCTMEIAHLQTVVAPKPGLIRASGTDDNVGENHR